MMELTTGVVFLMSSLYGSGQVIPQTAAIANSVNVQQHVTTVTESSSFKDPKQVEAYVKAAYVSEPILINIARCESNFKQFDENGEVIRGKVNQGDVGVMQINEKYHSDEAVAKDMNIYTTEGNVSFAKVLYDKFGTDPWSSSESCWGSSLASTAK